jgi:hypothetical protein
MKYLIYFFFVISLKLLISCSCNVAGNYKMLELIMTEPDSIYTNIAKGNIIIDTSYFKIKQYRIDGLRKEIREYFPDGYKIIFDNCARLENTNEYSHIVVIESKSYSNEKRIFFFTKHEGGIWKYNGTSVDPSLLDQYRERN